MDSPTQPTMPAFYISHGGGPCFFMDGKKSPMFKEVDKNSDVRKWYENFHSNFMEADGWKETDIKAILVVSAHWEEGPHLQLTTQDPPQLLYDYYGFPESTYHLQYNCPHSPWLADRVIELLGNNGIQCDRNDSRGLDHGVFIPLKLMYPSANIPVVQLSLRDQLDGSDHLNIGKSLAELRKEGVLIIGSGSTTHSFSGQYTPQHAASFIEWLTTTLVETEPTAEGWEEVAAKWEEAPGARESHPREEHLIPLFVVMGSSFPALPSPSLIYDKMVNGVWSFASFRF